MIVCICMIYNCFLDDYEDQLENPYLYLWIAASILSSCYAYTWDIKMDWGLFDSSASENKILREETVYSSTVSIKITMNRIRTQFVGIYIFLCFDMLPNLMLI